MPPEESVILEAIRKALSEKKDRNFKESVDLHIGLKGIDLKDPSKRFRAEILLPHKLNKPVRLCVIGDEAIATRARTQV